MVWKITEYVTEEGTNLIRDWYAAQEPAVRAEFDVTVAILKQTDDWLDPPIEPFKLLTGNHRGLDLGELRFWKDERLAGAAKSKRRRFRVIGIYLPAEREFILILGCEKFGMNTAPPRAFDAAAQYKREFDEGRGWKHEHH